MRLTGAGSRDGEEPAVHQTFWTVANVITVLRFLLVPLFVLAVARSDYMSAFWLLAVLGSTDWVDGFVARRFDQMSTVGQWLDPLADRLSLMIVTLTLTVFDVAPIWVVLAVVVPDVMLAINATVLFRGSPELPVTMLGKVRTACLLLGTPLILLGRTDALSDTALPIVAIGLLALGCLMHIIASGGYLVQAHQKARRLRAEGITPRNRGQWSLKNTTRRR